MKNEKGFFILTSNLELRTSASSNPSMRSIIVFTLLLASHAFAHDFWIEPSTFRPAAGDRVTAALRVGQRLQGEPLPRIPPLIDRFVLDNAPMLGLAGSDPAGIAAVAKPGLQWIGYQSNPYPVTLDAAKFEQYLRDEGLERVIDERAKKGQSAAQGRERFYRCAKALLDAGGPSTTLRAGAKSGAVDVLLGFTLEFVPRKKPRAGDELPLTLLFRGKPAANVLVVAMSKSDPDKAVRARTDARGRVTLRIAHGGFWLVKAVHMQSAPPDAGVEWESWWASLTFEL
jgi:hypothetical protein